MTSSTTHRDGPEPERESRWATAPDRESRLGREQVNDAVAGLLHGPPARQPQYSDDQRDTLVKAGQLIVEWAVEVARYEADMDWQWSHRDDEDPAVTASALARLIRDARAVVGRAEGLLVTALVDGA